MRWLPRCQLIQIIRGIRRLFEDLKGPIGPQDEETRLQDRRVERHPVKGDNSVILPAAIAVLNIHVVGFVDLEKLWATFKGHVAMGYLLVRLQNLELAGSRQHSQETPSVSTVAQ